jgi:hypothetical protein
MFFKKGL